MAIDAKLADENYCYITTTGRLSGRPHTVEIWFALDGATLYVLAGGGHNADFVKNAKRQASVAVRVGTSEFTASARVVTDAAEDARARALVYDKYSRDYGDLKEWRRTALAVAFDLDGPSVAT
ncbi:MAG: nitroreductase family deazaflavin-dependent oxidoreductase [Chloroflexota bacterium]|nr:nitroreductase family deazaflavin-dependent oxidoreductase [Chloroflexota bacterium]